MAAADGDSTRVCLLRISSTSCSKATLSRPGAVSGRSPRDASWASVLPRSTGTAVALTYAYKGLISGIVRKVWILRKSLDFDEKHLPGTGTYDPGGNAPAASGAETKDKDSQTIKQGVGTQTPHDRKGPKHFSTDPRKVGGDPGRLGTQTPLDRKTIDQGGNIPGTFREPLAKGPAIGRASQTRSRSAPKRSTYC